MYGYGQCVDWEEHAIEEHTLIVCGVLSQCACGICELCEWVVPFGIDHCESGKGKGNRSVPRWSVGVKCVLCVMGMVPLR